MKEPTITLAGPAPPYGCGFSEGMEVLGSLLWDLVIPNQQTFSAGYSSFLSYLLLLPCFQVPFSLRATCLSMKAHTLPSSLLFFRFWGCKNQILKIVGTVYLKKKKKRK